MSVHVHAQARAQTHTHTDTRANASPSLCLPTRTLSLCCCQTKAWKAGHKGECEAAARASTRRVANPDSALRAATAAKPTADQIRVLEGG